MMVLRLSQMTSEQLMGLFAVTPNLPLSERAKRIIDELERRGYIFDVRFGDFVTCVEWNRRHGASMPLDCIRCETVIINGRVQSAMKDSVHDSGGESCL